MHVMRAARSLRACAMAPFTAAKASLGGADACCSARTFSTVSPMLPSPRVPSSVSTPASPGARILSRQASSTPTTPPAPATAAPAVPHSPPAPVKDVLPPIPRPKARKRKRPFTPVKADQAPFVATYVVSRADAKPPHVMRPRVDVARERASPSSAATAASAGGDVSSEVRFVSTESSVTGSDSDAGTAAGSSAPTAPRAPPLFAVVNLAGTQYKVCVGDVVNAEYLPQLTVGSSVTLKEVAVVGSDSMSVLGRPLVPHAHVVMDVEEHAQASKTIVYKKKRRKRYQRTRGHRRLVTVLRVKDIVCDMQLY